MFNKKLKQQVGILKQQTQIDGITLKENTLITLTGWYDKIYDKNAQQIIIVEVFIRAKTTFVRIDIFKNAPALKRLIPKN